MRAAWAIIAFELNNCSAVVYLHPHAYWLSGATHGLFNSCLEVWRRHVAFSGVVFSCRLLFRYFSSDWAVCAIPRSVSCMCVQLGSCFSHHVFSLLLALFLNEGSVERPAVLFQQGVR